MLRFPGMRVSRWFNCTTDIRTSAVRRRHVGVCSNSAARGIRHVGGQLYKGRLRGIVFCVPLGLAYTPRINERPGDCVVIYVRQFLHPVCALRLYCLRIELFVACTEAWSCSLCTLPLKHAILNAKSFMRSMLMSRAISLR